MATLTQKLPKITPQQRRERILALQTSGKTQDQIAAILGVSRKTIVNDLVLLKPSRDAVEQALETLNGHFEDLQSLEDVALNYVALATKEKNGAVRLGAQDRIMEYRGIKRKDKDREPAQPQALFMFPPGTRIDFSVSTTTSSNKDAHNELGEGAINVTPEKSQ